MDDVVTKRIFTNYTEYRDSGGNYHRLNGPAVEWDDGDKLWFIHGKPHRLDGPAVEHNNGYKSWYNHGERHREDGPALVLDSGKRYWYLRGHAYNEHDYWVAVWNGDYLSTAHQWLPTYRIFKGSHE